MNKGDWGWWNNDWSWDAQGFKILAELAELQRQQPGHEQVRRLQVYPPSNLKFDPESIFIFRVKFEESDSALARGARLVTDKVGL